MWLQPDARAVRVKTRPSPSAEAEGLHKLWSFGNSWNSFPGLAGGRCGGRIHPGYGVWGDFAGIQRTVPDGISWPPRDLVAGRGRLSKEATAGICPPAGGPWGGRSRSGRACSGMGCVCDCILIWGGVPVSDLLIFLIFCFFWISDCSDFGLLRWALIVPDGGTAGDSWPRPGVDGACPGLMLPLYLVTSVLEYTFRVRSVFRQIACAIHLCCIAQENHYFLLQIYN